MQSLLQERQSALKEAALEARIASETIDVTLPPVYTPAGHRHPLLSTTDAIVDIFCGLGYRVVEGPDIESDYYNFSALNIPEEHPARDMQDTFYLPGDRLLRTHTSPVQIRHLEQRRVLPAGGGRRLGPRRLVRHRVPAMYMCVLW